MANNIDKKELNNVIRDIDIADPSRYAMGPTFSNYLNTKDIQSQALSIDKRSSTLEADAIQESNNIIQKCQSEEFYVTPRDQIVTGSGFEFKEIVKPKQPSKANNTTAAVGSSSFPPPLARGVVCGTYKGNSIFDLSFNCNFVAGMNLDSCLFKFQKEVKVYLTKLEKYLLSFTLGQIPGLEFIKKQIENICQMASQIAKIICFIQQLIACITNSILALVRIIDWILTLPVRLLQSLIQCVTSFFGNIVGSLGSIIGALKYIAVSLFGKCFAYNCPTISDISEITDLSTVTSDFSYAASDFGYGFGNVASQLV